MLRPRYSTQFMKDYKLALRWGRDERLFIEVLDKNCSGKSHYRHGTRNQLTGNWAKHRECHIQPDWLLIYSINEEELILELSRTGTHSDLF